MEKNLIINRIPSLTYRWLRMNETNIKVPESPAVCGCEVQVPAGVETETVPADAALALATGSGEETAAWICQNMTEIPRFALKDETAADAPLRLRFSPAKAGAYACEITVGAGSSLTVVEWMDLSALKEEDAFALQTRYDVAEGASLTLIQVQTGSACGKVFSNLGGHCAEKGSFALYQIILGAKQSFYGNTTALAGKRSSMTADIAYFLQENETLDMNYLADHTGKKTTCNMYAAGVLCDHASKLFRGTIDFKQGAKDAVGSELEEVLLMDENCVCRTIPVILCAEEDVEGNHGASIGRLDEGLMFYLQSRGIDPEAIYEMMARARVEAVVNRIPEEETKKALLEILDAGLFRR